MRQVVVVGGGVSGLVVAHRLAELGLDPVVLEASERLGGSIRSERHGGFLTERGPTLLFVNDPPVTALLERLGLSSSLVLASDAMRTRYLARDGKVRLVPPGSKLLTSDLLSLMARMRLFAELATPASRSEDESILEFGRRHVGDEVTRTLIDPVVAMLFAGNIGELSAQSCFPSIHALERRHRSLAFGILEEHRRARETGERPPWGNGTLFGLREGMEQLPTAFGQSLKNRVRLGQAATSVSFRADGVRVQLRSGDKIEASAAVLAVPAYDAAALLDRSVPEAAVLLRQVPYAPVAAVQLGYPRDAIAENTQALGLFIPGAEGTPLLGCVYTSALFPHYAPQGQVLFTAFMGGARRPDLSTRSPQALIGLAHETLAHLLGIGCAPHFARAHAHPRAIPQYVVGTSRRRNQLEQLLGRAGPVFLSGSAYDGIGVGDCLRRGLQLADRIRHRLQVQDSSAASASRV